MIVDCRKCRYFEDLSVIQYKASRPCNHFPGYADLYEQLLVYEAKYNERVLGYCWRYRRPVRYYKGKCRGFERIYTPPAKHPITYYLSNR